LEFPFLTPHINENAPMTWCSKPLHALATWVTTKAHNVSDVNRFPAIPAKLGVNS
jgi:hypothetical protein